MPTVQNPEADILNILKFPRMCKVMDISPLCHKVAYEPCIVVEGSWGVVERQGHFAQCL